MSRGPLYTKHLDDTLKREIYETQIPNIEFLYEHSSTKNPEYNIGDRVLLPDGRVFRYGLMANSGQAVFILDFHAESTLAPEQSSAVKYHHLAAVGL